MQQKPATVSSISKYFENGQKTRTVSIMGPGMKNKYNNNGVCMATANPILTRSSTRADPEMAVQSAAAGRPMATEGLKLSGHMTTEEPTGGENQNLGQNMWDRSHLV